MFENSLFLVADTQLYKRLCPSVGWSVEVIESKSGKMSVLELFRYVCVWSGVRGVDGVGRPCPPVRNDTATPRHLLNCIAFLRPWLIICLSDCPSWVLHIAKFEVSLHPTWVIWSNKNHEDNHFTFFKIPLSSVFVLALKFQQKWQKSAKSCVVLFRKGQLFVFKKSWYSWE